MFELIQSNPEIMCGKAVIKGTRIPVYVILDLLSGGSTFDDIIAAYPDLTPAAIRQAILYASELTKGEELLEVTIRGSSSMRTSHPKP